MEPPSDSNAQRPALRNSTRVRIATYAASIVLFLGICSVPSLVVLCFVPLIVIFALPALSLLLLVIALIVPQLAYLVLAQTDAPPHASSPFLTASLTRCLKIDIAVLMWFREGIGLGMRFFGDWARRKYLQQSSSVQLNVRYDASRARARLDIYTPERVPHSRALYPVIVFIPPQTRPFLSTKWFFSSFGANLAKLLSVVVVIPDLTPYPQGRIHSQICDARLALHHVQKNATSYGGDPTQIYLSGHGLSALLALLLPLQQSVAESRDDALRANGGAHMPNGVANLEIYAGDVTVPTLAGLILLAPITDIDAHIMHEGERGIHHLSIVRRVCGPGQVASYFHSPAHLLFASRSILDVQKLPSRVLFLHGGLDATVQHVQSESMKELFRGIGVVDVRVRIFPVGHWGIITSLMFGTDGPISRTLIEQLQQFIYPPTDMEATPRVKNVLRLK